MTLNLFQIAVKNLPNLFIKYRPEKRLMAKKKSRAEIQREYRQRRDANQDKRAAYLQSRHFKYEKDKEEGKVKLIAEMNDREKRKTRRDWKQRQQICRERAERIQQTTPPATPDGSDAPSTTRQRVAGAKMKRKEKTAAYKRIKTLEAQLDEARRKAEKYKKRYQRFARPTPPPGCKDTPRTKTRKLMQCFKLNKASVRKTLLFHHALVDEIRNRYQDTRCERDKRLCANIVTGKIVRKYKLQQLASESLGFSYKRWRTQSRDSKELSAIQRCTLSSKTVYCKTKQMVLNFYERDDVSRIKPGKKDTVTYKSQKKQKRLLTDVLKNVYHKFLAEHAQLKLSYSLFCSLRPFWVVPPSTRDMETCQCKIHENAKFMAEKLYNLHLLNTQSVEKIAQSCACNSESKDCMYGVCADCKVVKLPFACSHISEVDAIECTNCKSSVVKILKRFDQNEIVTYYQWVLKSEEHDGKVSRITVKDLISTTSYDLVEQFESSLVRMKKHSFNIKHQYSSYRELRRGLEENECLLHIDFAENFNCKYSQEIQSCHFGGSHKQVTMHTGVLYVGQRDPLSFCTLSDSRQHDPVGIWCYLKPVFELIKSDFPSVTIVHFYSDGPTTQYRQKKNFYFFSTSLLNFGFRLSTWNFFEASHGKGAADGIGAVLKRSADRLVREGTDIPNAKVAFEKLSCLTTIKLFFVSGDAVQSCNEFHGKLDDLPTVPGTMSLHQLIADSKFPGKLMFRDVSCFCRLGDQKYLCDCFLPKTFVFSNAYLTPNKSAEGEPGIQNNVISESVIAANADKDGELCHTIQAANEIGVRSSEDTSEILCLQPIASSDFSLIGKCCVVQYNGKPYPGRILSFDETDVEVECMHCNGSKYDNNLFFWPADKQKDVCFYPYIDILTLISEPVQVADHGRLANVYKVDPSIWKLCENHVNL